MKVWSPHSGPFSQPTVRDSQLTRALSTLILISLTCFLWVLVFDYLVRCLKSASWIANVVAPDLPLHFFALASLFEYLGYIWWALMKFADNTSPDQPAQMLNQDIPHFCKQCRSRSVGVCIDLHCLSLSRWICINNLEWIIWLADNLKWAWHLNSFSITRVNPSPAEPRYALPLQTV